MFEGLLALGDDLAHFLLLEEALEGDLLGDGVLRFEFVHACTCVAGLDCLMLSIGTSKALTLFVASHVTALEMSNSRSAGEV